MRRAFPISRRIFPRRHIFRKRHGISAADR
jgi:hypothetical protein